MIDYVKELRTPEQVWLFEALPRRLPQENNGIILEVEDRLRRHTQVIPVKGNLEFTSKV